MAREYWVHHLNDFSGSPLIIMESLKKQTKDSEITLITNQDIGFLSPWGGSKVIIGYTKCDNKVLRFFSLSSWYIKTTFFLICSIKKGDKLVLSTLIASPLAIVQKFHPGISLEIRINEVLFRVPIWRNLGLLLLNSRNINKVYLSHFVRDSWRFFGPEKIVYPSIRLEFLQRSRELEDIPNKDTSRLKFFLVCSYIEAKGYKLFIEIARHFEREKKCHQFWLYLSGDKNKFQHEYSQDGLPNNLKVDFNRISPEIFYGHDVFLGLTDPSRWIETFGQTFAEAMIVGNIVVVPPVGAQLEYVIDGVNGMVFREYSLNGILLQIERIIHHRDLSGIANRAKNSMIRFFDENTI